jgi:hypothetical protein
LEAAEDTVGVEGREKTLGLALEVPGDGMDHPGLVRRAADEQDFLL